MRVPAHIRFTLAELTAFGLQSAEVLARANSAIHLVLTEQQEGLPSSDAQDECSIISVEDADGITVAVLKHPEGKAWARVTNDGAARSEPEGKYRLEVPMTAFRAGLPSSEPVVPRREPPQAAPVGEDRFQRGVSAMYQILRQLQEAGRLRGFGFVVGPYTTRHDRVAVDGEFSLRELARAFLDAYQPQITISDQVQFKLAKRAMKLLLLRERSRYESLSFLGPYNDTVGDDQVDGWDDVLRVEGILDIDALAKAAWSVMKGEG